MERKAIAQLVSWLDKSDRKPLIIRGARQVGKTWLVRHFSEVSGKTLLELNFERDPNLISLFKNNDPKKTLVLLETYFNQTIVPDQSLLFLDEIQAAPALLAKLRWFCEELSELAVIAAGSLLDFALEKHEFSMPVGRISYLYLEPMSFEEFLLAIGQDKLYDFLHHYQLDDQIPAVMHERLWNLLREYVVIGGLPEVVKNWVNNQSLLKASEIQQNLLATYRDDFAKYVGRISSERLEEVLSAVPRLLGKKFKYSQVNNDIQSVTVKTALHLLSRARICHKVNYSHGNGLPLLAESKENFFKMIFLDVGLVSVLLGLNLKDSMNINDLLLVHEGGVAEQLVGQLLRTVQPSFIDPTLYYWIREKAGASAEIDYLIQHETNVIPIEVKSGTTGTLRSLHVFMGLKKLSIAIRFNADVPSVTAVKIKDHQGKLISYRLLSLPLYLVEQTHRLLLN
ncbi:MAG: AAA family ATPase [Gammaproteobacteria bacterium RIFCSPHIGHO2_02_FULL_42_13]|nr:MAG: AAA family ATPase [Gammaproteobacteria bacterium RIFCSPHIGHO2_02_FULL_42_13]OGT68055.1 MAG: AAA family ATPase [Gammaproteobacteria bacterium RIFCSPLOWO2_02_FULL_42_9]